MTPLSTLRLEAFARLIALGWPPVLAAKDAGYRNMRASRAATRLAEAGVSARVEELKPRKAGTKPKAGEAKADAEDDAEDGAPPLPPIMTEEEWMAEFAPHLLEKKGAAP